MSDISEQSNSDENICIICLEELDNNKISLQACKCKNKVHADCLLTWIEHKNRIDCEICKSDYIIPINIINNFINNIDNNYYNYSHYDYNNQNLEHNINPENIEISIQESDNRQIDESDESSSDDEETEENQRHRINFENYNICRRTVVYYVMLIVPLICLTFMISILVISIKNYN